MKVRQGCIYASSALGKRQMTLLPRVSYMEQSEPPQYIAPPGLARQGWILSFNGD